MTRPPWPTGFSGVVLAQRSGTTVFERVQGLADHGRREPCTRGTRFQIASVSKQFTAAAVLLLAGRGLISLQDRIERWLGTCPAPWRPITVHHLLTHTAGGTAAGQRAYFHSGGNPGYRAVNAWLPDDDVRIALCGNDEAADIGQILTQALREALAF